MEKKQTASGSKDHQRSDTEDRSLSFRKHIRQHARWLYSTDADLIEYRIINGHLAPVAVLEITRIDGFRPPPQKYFDAILDRFINRDNQAEGIVQLAKMLFCDAYIVAFLSDLSTFWVYNLTTEKGWQQMDNVQLEYWRKTLKSVWRLKKCSECGAVTKYEDDYKPPWFA